MHIIASTFHLLSQTIKMNECEVQNSPRLVCNVTMESTDLAGNCVRKVTHKNASLGLLRNEFKELVLTVEASRAAVMSKYPIHQLILHTRFVKEGKGGIQLPDKNVKFLLSNCAATQLCLFFKLLSLKYNSWKNLVGSSKGTVNQKQLFLTTQRTPMTEISPINNNDIATCSAMRLSQQGNCAKRLPVKSQQTTTPIRRGQKRKLVEDSSNDEVRIPLKSCNSNVRNFGLTEEQNAVLNIVLGGKNVFFTGSAGTGKSFLLKKIVRALPSDVTFVTASTGVAASHIGGITLHAFAGIGSGSAPLKRCVDKMSAATLQQWRRCRHLIIDEVSMVNGEFFAKIEKLACLVRNNDRPFGGIQLVLCGDFLQLPPVVRENAPRTFCFQTKAWERCVDVCLELVTVHRQTDQEFIDILSNLRVGRCTDAMCDVLKSTAGKVLSKEGIVATHLCSHNGDAKEINNEQLDKLPGGKRIFTAIDSESTLGKWFDQQCPVESRLVLKEGTQVILLKNLDVQLGLVNGARGVVLAFDHGQQGLPIVRFFCGVQTVIKFERWIVNCSSAGAQLIRSQIPLRLAWAISIHKAQGMTLDCVKISLSKIFECGQAYVALSRAKNLQGLKVVDFDRNCIRAEREVLEFYSRFSRCVKELCDR